VLRRWKHVTPKFAKFDSLSIQRAIGEKFSHVETVCMYVFFSFLPLVFVSIFIIIRVTTCLENVEMSGNLTAVREMSGILLKIRELSEKKSCRGKVA